jgi:hypothetical protein
MKNERPKPHPPPDWMERGFEATVADPASIRGAIDAFSDLAEFVPAERAGPVIDKLLPLLGNQYSHVRSAAAQALGRIATGERAGPVIDKLLPLLGDQNIYVRSAAAQALPRIATGERAGAVIDKLLPLLGNQDISVRSAAAQALGRIATGERAGAVIDKLLPILGGRDSYVWRAAAQALGRIGPAGLSASVTAVRLINSSEDAAAGRFRAAAHVATGADAKKEGSELLLAWLGRPEALPLVSVADNPAQAQRVLKLLTDNWAALSSVPRGREEAENAVMAAIQAACQTPTETSSLVIYLTTDAMTSFSGCLGCCHSSSLPSNPTHCRGRLRDPRGSPRNCRPELSAAGSSAAVCLYAPGERPRCVGVVRVRGRSATCAGARDGLREREPWSKLASGASCY